MDELEENLDEVERRLEEAKLTDKYNQLVEAQAKQKKWIEDYSHELITLTKAVDNIHVINETIPRKCFMNIELEPTDPTG